MRRAYLDQRGFTLIETMVALAIVVAIAAVGLQMMTAGMRTLASVRPGGASDGREPLLRFADRLRADARSATAVDVAVGANGAAQVLFYGRDDRGSADYWSYGTVGGRVVRSEYGPPADGPDGIPAAAPNDTSVVPGLTAIAVHRIEADRLRDAAVNAAYAGGLAPLAPTACRDVPTTRAGSGACGSVFAGGNHVVAVTMRGPSGSLTVHLLGGALPSNFTVRSAASAHVVVYRVDRIHRTWLGVAQKTFSDVKGSVSLSWGGGSYVSWCPEITIYDRLGSGPGGIFESGPDEKANFNRDDRDEQPTSLIRKCVAMAPHPPKPNGAPLPQTTPPPDTFDTPPPGEPMPANYTPPPDAYAPPEYCAQYAGRSPLCNAKGEPLRTPPPARPPGPPIIYIYQTPYPVIVETPRPGGDGG